MEISDGVTLFAAIFEGLGGKLIVVSILVAIETGGELHFINGVFAGRNVTFGALDFHVQAFERIF